MILGIDEVGRGPWAGPLVVGAVVLGGAPIDGLTDSKKLSKKRREELDSIIRANAAGWALGWVQAEEIDRMGLSAALRLATRRAVEAVKTPYSEITIDGTINFLSETALEKYVTTMPKADLLVPSVSAASIIAKVARDAYMKKQALVYPEYGFDRHAGYGVQEHRKALEQYGPCPIHRMSFKPLAQMPEAKDSQTTPIELTSGRRAEEAASRYLVQQGHAIIERNWKTKWCEIDIVSRKDNMIYFTEVKHRKDANSGDGIAAITPKKLAQMRFAARVYLSDKSDANGQLACIATAGENPAVVDYLEII